MDNAVEWNQTEDLFHRILELPPLERIPYLTAEEGVTPAVRQEVESLLRCVEDADLFLEEPIANDAMQCLALDGEDRTGEVIGSYRLVRRLGQGGIGVVYLAQSVAQRHSGFVAIKLLIPGMDTQAMLARFLQERLILAELRHPRIARLLDAGTLDNGRPYLVMEAVEGVPIDQYCADRNLPVVARLKLFLQVCEAVSYAHQRLVIHRDLKPSNILIKEDGSVKLLDFGTAKLLEADGIHLTAPAPALVGAIFTPAMEARSRWRGRRAPQPRMSSAWGWCSTNC